MKFKYTLILLLGILSTGCKKFLDEKPNGKLVVPNTVASMQSLLDNHTLLNQKEVNVPITTCDDFQMTTANWLSLSQYVRNLHVWSTSNAFEPGNGGIWATLYGRIYQANVVLDDVDKVYDREQHLLEWQNVKGQALFLRARTYFDLLQFWAKPYDAQTAATDLGVPLRLDANFNTPSSRSTVAKGYAQMLHDFKQAAQLLPNYSIHPIRPSKPAVYTFLARTHLVMQQVDSALHYTNLALQLKNNLMDYNGGEGVVNAVNNAFVRFNPEVIFDTYLPYPSALQKGDIDPLLYASYHNNDLRRTMYHRTATAVGVFRGSYSGYGFLFNGVATDELYLMKAECLARKNDAEGAIRTLNTLLVKRFKTGTYLPYVATNAQEALAMVLQERRKEMVFRGWRWMDVRRLNKMGANITMRRNLDGKEYVLAPNSAAYALPIPEDIIAMTGMPQNGQ